MAPPLKAMFSAGLTPFGCGLRGAHVGAYRHVHADVAREGREDCADGESDRRVPVQRDSQDEEQDDAHDGDRAVLPVHVGACAFLDCLCDLLHPVVAGRLLENPL